MSKNTANAKIWQINLLLLLLVVCLAVIPLVVRQDAEFMGADGEAEEIIMSIDEDYEPWFSPLYEPASGEIESLLFVLQAAIGAGIIGYYFGTVRERRQHAKSQ